MTLKLGDRVRIDIPDELDPDFNLYGEHAIVLDNDPGRCRCGCEVLYKVALEVGTLGEVIIENSTVESIALRTFYSGRLEPPVYQYVPYKTLTTC